MKFYPLASKMVGASFSFIVLAIVALAFDEFILEMRFHKEVVLFGKLSVAVFYLSILVVVLKGGYDWYYEERH